MPSINKRSLFVLIAFVALAVAATTAAANWAPGWSFGFFAPTSENTSSTAAPIAGVPPQGTTAPIVQVDDFVAPLAISTAWDFSPQAGGANNFGPSPLAATASDPNMTVGGLTRG